MTAAEDSANGLPWGTSRPSTTRPNPYILSHADSYRGRIERAAGVEINVSHHRDDHGDGFVEDYWLAWVNDESDSDAVIRSRTVATDTAFSEVAVLDGIARQLGVFERLHADEVAA